MPRRPGKAHSEFRWFRDPFMTWAAPGARRWTPREIASLATALASVGGHAPRAYLYQRRTVSGRLSRIVFVPYESLD